MSNVESLLDRHRAGRQTRHCDASSAAGAGAAGVLPPLSSVLPCRQLGSCGLACGAGSMPVAGSRRCPYRLRCLRSCAGSGRRGPDGVLRRGGIAEAGGIAAARGGTAAACSNRRGGLIGFAVGVTIAVGIGIRAAARAGARHRRRWCRRRARWPRYPAAATASCSRFPWSAERARRLGSRHDVGRHAGLFLDRLLKLQQCRYRDAGPGFSRGSARSATGPGTRRRDPRGPRRRASRRAIRT